MLVPTYSSFIISDDLKDQSLNTIKIDFSKMSFVNSTKDKYTQCPGCKALLTIDDKKYVSNKNVDQLGKFVWVCRFCKKQNHNQQLYFVSSNFKYCIQKNVPTKIVPPIILFLIDISGSMTSSIYMDLWSKSEDKNGKKNGSIITNNIKNIIEDSLMRKNEAQYLTELQKSFGNKNNKEQKTQHFSKLSFLFAVIQHHLKVMKSKKNKSQHRIGFIFFSDSLTVLKGARQKSIPMYVHQTDLINQTYPFKKQKIDFNSFQQLFKKGKTYDRFFGDSKFSTFDINKLSLQHIKTGGKTALGPALAFASGIISEHDQGSKLIVVTDSMPNYGIFQSKQTSMYYNKISQTLKQNKGTMGIFRLVSNQYQNLKYDNQFQKFVKSNQQIIKLIQISLKPAISQQIFQNTIKSLRNLINHQSVGHSYNLIILNENKKITLNKFKFDNIDYRNLRFITSQSKSWIQMNIQKKQLQQNDFLFPWMTQLIIQYDDVFTKEKCLFMSYIIQRIVKPVKKPLFTKRLNSKNQQHNQQEYEQYSDQINLQNIQNIIDMQSMKKFEQERQTDVLKLKTFRTQLKNIIIKLPNNAYVQSIDCQNINDYTTLQNQVISGGNEEDQQNYTEQSQSL